MRVLNVRIGSKTFKYVFVRALRDRTYERALELLAWTGLEAVVLDSYARADFNIAVHVHPPDIEVFGNLAGMKFVHSCESVMCWPDIPDCHQFVADVKRNDGNRVHYSPSLLFWARPTSERKDKCCSIVESGKYGWRNEIIAGLKTRIDVDVLGRLGQRIIPQDAKETGIARYGFYLALENALHNDYITEKFNDAILCEAVPVYRGAPNIHLYALEGSYLAYDRVAEINWAEWEAEYAKREEAVKRQKALLRRTFNIFSYYEKLTSDLSLLDRRRPITLENA